MRSSPRASIGLIMLPASTAPSAPPDLFVAPDDGVELALAGVLGEVAPVLLERLVLLFRVLAGDAMTAAHLLERAEDRVVADAETAEEITHAAGDLAHGEEHVLGG